MPADEEALLDETRNVPAPVEVTVALGTASADVPILAAQTTGANLVTRTGIIQPIAGCRICKRSHPLRFCRTFRSMPFEGRLRQVVLHRYCSRCLAHSHLARDCHSQGRCRICQGDHHVLLHSASGKPITAQGSRTSRSRGPARSRESSRAVQRRSSAQPRLGTAAINYIPSVSPTIILYLRFNRANVTARAVLDPCSTENQICRSLADDLRLPVSYLDGIAITRFTAVSTYDATQHITVTATVRDLRHVVTPRESVPARAATHFVGLPLADPEFYRSGPVAVVFGSQSYTSIVHAKSQSSPGLPLAMYSIFGWVLSGPCLC